MAAFALPLALPLLPAAPNDIAPRSTWGALQCSSFVAAPPATVCEAAENARQRAEPAPGSVYAPEDQPESDFDLVEVVRIDPSIRVDLRYATADHVFGKPMYENGRCFARRSVARKLAAAQREFQEMGLSLLVWDLYRPRHVQYEFWDYMPDERFVANPDKGSNHSRGAAVDCTLVDADGSYLPMPTAFDDFTERAARAFADAPAEQLRNRDLLTRVMERHGFVGLPSEWWHFDAEDCASYALLDIPLGFLASHMHAAEQRFSRGVPYYPLSA
eukprot:tig00000498_g1597.t1